MDSLFDLSFLVCLVRQRRSCRVSLEESAHI